MNPWFTVLRQTISAKRYLPYVMAVWVVGGAAMTAAVWPECTYPLDSMEGMGLRLPSFFLVTLGILVWGSLLYGLDLQLSAGAVQLVPGLRRAAVIVAIVSWLVIATGVALQTCVYGVPFAVIFPCLLLAIALSVSRRPTARRYVALIVLFLLGAPMYGYRFPLPAGPDPVPSWVAWTAAVIAIAMGATFIVTEIGKSAEAHAVLYRIVRSWSEPHHQRTEQSQSVLDSILKRPRMFQWVFDRTLRARSPEVRVLHGLGPAFHWSQAAVGGVVQAGPVCLFTYVASRLVFEPYGAPSGVDLVLLNASIMAFFFSIQLADRRMRELWARRKEQALLLIVPGAPTGPDVNRWLMQTLVLQHAIAVVSALWFVTAMAFVLHQPLEAALKATSAPLAVSLLVTPALLRDYASMRQPRRLQYTLYAGISLLPLYLAVNLRGGIHPMIVIVVALSLSGILAARRYARLVDAATAFPVGRLAT